jgi:hypothetical protein
VKKALLSLLTKAPKGPKLTPRHYTSDQIVQHLHAHDGSGDPNFLADLEEHIRKHPHWELANLDPKKHTNWADGSPNREVVDDYRRLGTPMPPIIAIPGLDGRHEILDGMHRADAAVRNRQLIAAFIPKGSLQNKTSAPRLGKSEPLDKGVQQRLWPHKPTNLPQGTREAMETWQDDQPADMREEIGATGMEHHARQRALHRLSAATKVRRTPGGKREFLLHRGMSEDEFRGNRQGNRIVHPDGHSSWTPNYDIAHQFKKIYSDDDGDLGDEPMKGGVVSAWVHEAHIKFVPNQYAADSGGANDPKDFKQGPYHKEHEVIVGPNHRSEMVHRDHLPALIGRDKEGKDKPADVNQIINTRAAHQAEPGTVGENMQRKHGLLNVSPKLKDQARQFAQTRGKKLASSETGTLEKGVAAKRWPFKPDEETTLETRRRMTNWQNEYERNARDVLGQTQMGANAKQRALHKLHGKTAVRRAADGGREFLLHRGMGPTEYRQTRKFTSEGKRVMQPSLTYGHTSWTPHLHIATTFEDNDSSEITGEKPEPNGGVASAWVHEQHIRFVPRQYGSASQDSHGQNEYSEEHEIIVAPNHNSELVHRDEVKRLLATDKKDTKRADGFSPTNVNQAINARSQLQQAPASARQNVTRSYREHRVKKTDPMGLSRALDKSNYGPKGAGQYTAADNVRRKQANAGDQPTGIQGIKVKTGANASGGQGKAQLNRENAKILSMNRKQPVKVYSEEEKKALQAKMQQPKKLAASELEKRSKNVRQQTRNITPEQRKARIAQLMARHGVFASEGRQDRFGIGPKQNRVTYTPHAGSPEHEFAHYLMTPDGMTPRQYQKQLGQVTATSSMSHEDRVRDESTAFHMEPMIARRAGVAAPGRLGIGGFTSQETNDGRARAREVLGRKLDKSEQAPKPRHNEKIRQVADQYAASKGLTLNHGAVVKVNPERAAKIAQTYHSMPHQPAHPEVKRSYEALINETMDQFHHIKRSGLKISKIKNGMENPYKNGSKDLVRDVKENNHMWYYPTESGFGSSGEKVEHPMLSPTHHVDDEGKQMLANDVFRVVHDYFGHCKEGFAFGPTGEENAWHHHKQMFSPLAQKALTTETRGQNSWVNFGPHGEHNRKNPASTIYADQKAGLLPDWAHDHSEGGGK